MKVDAIILAGGKNKIIPEQKVRYKAQLMIKNKSLVDYVLAEILKCKNIQKIALVGPKNLTKIKNNRILYTPLRQNILDCVIDAAKKLKSQNFLVLVADLPLVKAYMIDEFIQSSLKSQADFCTAIVEKIYFEKKYPYQNKSFINLHEGTFGSHFNLFYVTCRLFQNKALLSKIRDLYKVRKNRFKVASLFGTSVLAYFIFNIWPIKKDTLKQATKKLKKMIGLDAAIIKMPYPEFGIDVDTRKDF